ncbi:MAG: hypothetical protein PW999_00595 [Paraburkholderia tropica]|nr:hypothetical protein [Paraburkholderia tropica]
MEIPRDKIREAIDALHAAEKALLELDSENGQNGVIAGRCAIAAVYLETELEPRAHRVFRLVGDVN